LGSPAPAWTSLNSGKQPKPCVKPRKSSRKKSYIWSGKSIRAGVRGYHRPEQALAIRHGACWQSGGQRCDRAAAGRNGNGKGNWWREQSTVEPAGQQQLHQVELRCDSIGPGGKRVVREREGRVHRSGEQEDWPIELADKAHCFSTKSARSRWRCSRSCCGFWQDQEFERLGGTQTMKVDFRFDCATSRDLAEAVRESEFRSDLYYR